MSDDSAENETTALPRLRVAEVAQIPEGTGILVDVMGHCLAIFNVGGFFRAVDNKCPHMGGDLYEGTVVDGKVSCPWHAWEFSLETGHNPRIPTMSIGTYLIEQEGDSLFMTLPASG